MEYNVKISATSKFCFSILNTLGVIYMSDLKINIELLKDKLKHIENFKSI